jgi:hypothetical protein
MTDSNERKKALLLILAMLLACKLSKINFKKNKKNKKKESNNCFDKPKQIEIEIELSKLEKPLTTTIELPSFEELKTQNASRSNISFDEVQAIISSILLPGLILLYRYRYRANLLNRQNIRNLIINNFINSFTNNHQGLLLHQNLSLRNPNDITLLLFAEAERIYLDEEDSFSSIDVNDEVSDEETETLATQAVDNINEDLQNQDIQLTTQIEEVLDEEINEIENRIEKLKQQIIDLDNESEEENLKLKQELITAQEQIKEELNNRNREAIEQHERDKLTKIQNEYIRNKNRIHELNYESEQNAQKEEILKQKIREDDKLLSQAGSIQIAPSNKENLVAIKLISEKLASDISQNEKAKVEGEKIREEIKQIEFQNANINNSIPVSLPMGGFSSSSTVSIYDLSQKTVSVQNQIENRRQATDEMQIQIRDEIRSERQNLNTMQLLKIANKSIVTKFPGKGNLLGGYTSILTQLFRPSPQDVLRNLVEQREQFSSGRNPSSDEEKIQNKREIKIQQAILRHEAKEKLKIQKMKQIETINIKRLKNTSENIFTQSPKIFELDSEQNSSDIYRPPEITNNIQRLNIPVEFTNVEVNRELIGRGIISNQIFEIQDIGAIPNQIFQMGRIRQIPNQFLESIEDNKPILPAKKTPTKYVPAHLRNLPAKKISQKLSTKKIPQKYVPPHLRNLPAKKIPKSEIIKLTKKFINLESDVEINLEPDVEPDVEKEDELFITEEEKEILVREAYEEQFRAQEQEAKEIAILINEQEAIEIQNEQEDIDDIIPLATVEEIREILNQPDEEDEAELKIEEITNDVLVPQQYIEYLNNIIYDQEQVYAPDLNNDLLGLLSNFELEDYLVEDEGLRTEFLIRIEDFTKNLTEKYIDEANKLRILVTEGLYSMRFTIKNIEDNLINYKKLLIQKLFKDIYKFLKINQKQAEKFIKTIKKSIDNVFVKQINIIIHSIEKNLTKIIEKSKLFSNKNNLRLKYNGLLIQLKNKLSVTQKNFISLIGNDGPDISINTIPGSPIWYDIFDSWISSKSQLDLNQDDEIKLKRIIYIFKYLKRINSLNELLNFITSSENSESFEKILDLVSEFNFYQELILTGGANRGQIRNYKKFLQNIDISIFLKLIQIDNIPTINTLFK